MASFGGLGPAALIVNTRSRQGRRQLAMARRLLQLAGVDLIKVQGVENADLFGKMVEEAVGSRAQTVIIGGGDGSLVTAVGFFIGSDKALGLLPLGTANSFARALEVPLDLKGAVDVIARGLTRRVDLGEIDGRLYAGCASMGLAPQIAETVPHGLKAWAGRPGYLIWAATQLLRFKSFALTVEVRGKRHRMDAVEVRIANGPFHGGVELVETAKLDSGKIVLQAVTGEKRRHLLLNWAAHMVRSNERWRQICQYEGAEMRIATDPPLPISIDGEVLAHTPVTIKVRAAAILVIAPAPAKT